MSPDEKVLHLLALLGQHINAEIQARFTGKIRLSVELNFSQGGFSSFILLNEKRSKGEFTK